MQDRLLILQTLRKMNRAYRAGVKKLDYLPLRLWVELTNNCNLRCSFCPNSMPRKTEKGFMALDTFKEVVSQARSFAYDMNLSHRGESLLHEDLPLMIAHAKRNGIATRLNTNATLLNEEKSREIIEAGLDFISFSFDGLDPDAYESFRSGSSYDDTLNNVVNFLRMKQMLESPLPYVMLEVLDIPSVDGDAAEVKAFRSNFKNLPLNKLTMKPLHNWAGHLEDPEFAINPGSAMTPGLKYSPCTNIWYSMVVLWDGSVAICCQDWYNENCLGDIKDSSLEAMWNGETIVSVRELLAQKEFRQIEICSNCDLLWRSSLKGVPNVNLISFLTENLIGYSGLRRLFSPVERFLEGRKSLSPRKVIQ